MVTELVRVLPAAVAVAVVPGYFWSCVLIRASSPAERIAWSCAVSLGLVSAVALLLARVFGGVSTTIAIGTVAGVFVSGLLVHLVCKPAAGPARPALARASAPRHEALSRPLRCAATTAVFALTALRAYLPVVREDWPYLRGGDQFTHVVMAQQMMSVGSYRDYLIYPPGLSTTIATLSRVCGVDPLHIFPVLAPAFLLLAAAAGYTLAVRLWGWSYGVLAAAFAGVVVPASFDSLADARFPDFVDAYFLIVIAGVALIGILQSPTVRSGALFVITGSAVVLFHTVVTEYLAVLLVLVLAVVVPYLAVRRDRRRCTAVLLSAACLALVAIGYAWDIYRLPGLISGLLGSHHGAGSTAVTIAVGSQHPPSLSSMPTVLSPLLLGAGTLGCVVLAARGRRSTAQVAITATMLLWCALMFAGSRLAITGFPVRFERDLGAPLSALAALGTVSAVRAVFRRGAAARLAAPACGVLLVAVAALQLTLNLQLAFVPRDDILTPPVAEAGRWLRTHNHGGTIITTPWLFGSISNRAALAMGGYDQLQSFGDFHVWHPRSLPPAGRRPLLDSQTVLRHPASGEAGRILVRDDVRYVLVTGNYPRIDLTGFAADQGRYRKVFGNSVVTIYATGTT